MKFPQQHITKFTQSIGNVLGIIIGFGIVFPIFVVYQVGIIITKEISKTRETSVESKIHPKNTRPSEKYPSELMMNMPLFIIVVITSWVVYSLWRDNQQPKG